MATHARWHILDLGCGEGILFEILRPYGATNYTGIDISSVALARHIGRNRKRLTLVRADMDDFVPSERYSAVVLCESLHYLPDPRHTVHRYMNYLDDDGYIFMSVFEKGEGRKAYELVCQLSNVLEEIGSRIDEVLGFAH